MLPLNVLVVVGEEDVVWDDGFLSLLLLLLLLGIPTAILGRCRTIRVFLVLILPSPETRLLLILASQLLLLVRG